MESIADVGEASGHAEGVGRRMWSVCGGLWRNAGRRVIELWTVCSESRLVNVHVLTALAQNPMKRRRPAGRK